MELVDARPGNPAKRREVDTKRMMLCWVKLSEHAFEPVWSSIGAAGMNLRSACDVSIPARGCALAKTDIQIAVPKGCYARLARPSGLVLEDFIDVGAGVIDSNCRDNVGVVLFNKSEEAYEVKLGDHIAQLIFERFFMPRLKEVGNMAIVECDECQFQLTAPQNVVNIDGDLALDCPEPTERSANEYLENTAKKTTEVAVKITAISTNGTTKEETTKEGTTIESTATEDFIMEGTNKEDSIADGATTELETMEVTTTELDAMEVTTEFDTMEPRPVEPRLQRKSKTSIAL